jgi:hypothetical protein
MKNKLKSIINKSFNYIKNNLLIRIMIDIICISLFSHMSMFDYYQKRYIVMTFDVIFLILSLIVLYINLKKVIKK